MGVVRDFNTLAMGGYWGGHRGPDININPLNDLLVGQGKGGGGGGVLGVMAFNTLYDLLVCQRRGS